ncbi:hypothetical protein [Halomarina ordinaria]|uniref:Uncharacterized protein n=1 Tax=Halomarina ordinaria TaxID=3033939 RepID=A0ABD5UD95_9EURY|nr:hypothetical protein [Halomarina sp. PSRA2]
MSDHHMSGAIPLDIVRFLNTLPETSLLTADEYRELYRVTSHPETRGLLSEIDAGEYEGESENGIGHTTQIEDAQIRDLVRVGLVKQVPVSPGRREYRVTRLGHTIQALGAHTGVMHLAREEHVLNRQYQ